MNPLFFNGWTLTANTTAVPDPSAGVNLPLAQIILKTKEKKKIWTG
jgi:hypothetical protein